jgi:hypothetical protein
MEITETPTTVRLDQPVTPTGPNWELCFEFDLPGHSHSTGGIEAALIAASGQSYPLVDAELDRRGESVVCQIGRVDASEPGGVVFESIQLRAATRLRVRQIRGGA